MTQPARRQRSGGLAERRFPGWTRDPLAEFDDLFQRMGQLMESTVGGGAAATAVAQWTPLADIYETDDAYQIEVELPGVKADDVNVEVADRELTVSGDIKVREREGLLRRSTRQVGRFEFRAVLPNEVDAENVSANLDGGVLYLTVPKAQAAKPRHVEIQGGTGEQGQG
jgi:HSP20 family protein